MPARKGKVKTGGSTPERSRSGRGPTPRATLRAKAQREASEAMYKKKKSGPSRKRGRK